MEISLGGFAGVGSRWNVFSTSWRWAVVGRRWKSVVGQSLELWAYTMVLGPWNGPTLKGHSGRWPVVGSGVGRSCQNGPPKPKGRILNSPRASSQGPPPFSLPPGVGLSLGVVGKVSLASRWPVVGGMALVENIFKWSYGPWPI